MAQIYRHSYQEISVYGNVISLLRDHAGKTGVHLDIGCGYGAIAEPIRDQLGLTYIGFDSADDGMKALRERGFETHTLDLHDTSACESTIRRVVAGRPIASITMIDIIEHIINGSDVLQMVRRLVGENATALVISIPHVAHKDIALKTLIGRWDYTPSGLLDTTHLRFFTHASLTELTGKSGWQEIGAKDWLLETSDQSFPEDFIGFKIGTPVGHFLRSMFDQSSPHAIVNQFVRVYLPMNDHDCAVPATRLVDQQTFLTVVIRTQGKRVPQLGDALLSLAGQSLQDFDVLIVLHAPQPDHAAAVQELVDSYPESFRSRLRIIRCPPGSRAAPLNAAIPHLTGRYIVFLDDDDFVFGHYVETFKKLADSNLGRIVRAVCVLQNTAWQGTSALGPHPNPMSWFETPYPSNYNIFDHLTDNKTPFMSAAFPISVFRDLKLRFDEDITTAEDWDFTIRAAQLCGVACSPSITAVYRWWTDASPSSRAEHSRDEWHANRMKIISKIGSAPFLLPAGEILRVADQLGYISQQVKEALANYESTVAQLLVANKKIETLTTETLAVENDKAAEIFAARAKLIELLKSPYWKKTRFLRKFVGFVRGKRKADLRESNLPLTLVGLEREISRIKRSTSWRVTKPIRSVNKILRKRGLIRTDHS